MSVARDAFTKSTNFTSSVPPGTVTYGGVAMTLLEDAHDTVTEFIDSYLYFLGSGIPTGAQTVEIKKADNTTTMKSFTHTPVGTPKGVVVFVCFNTGSTSGDVNIGDAWAITLTADGDTAVEDSGIAQQNQANPSVALTTGASVETWVASLLGSGIASSASIAAGSGYTKFSVGDDLGGSRCAAVEDINANDAGGGVTVGWTVVSEDVAMVAVAIKEAAASWLPQATLL